MAIPNYTYSGVCYTGTGIQTTFALTTSAGESIGYLKKEHIHVYTSADGGDTWVGLSLDTDYVFADPATAVVLNEAPPDGTVVQLKRITPLDDDYIDFQAGSLLTANELNTFDTWQLYIDQELQDQVANVDGSTAGNAVKSVVGVEPIQVDNTNPQAPIVSVDQTQSTGDLNALTSDTTVLSEKAADDAFSTVLGAGDGTTTKLGRIRIDTGEGSNRAFYWNGSAWVQLGTDQGPPGPPGPAPGLQDPPAEATTVPLKPDGSLGDATALVSQDPSTYELKFLFGIPAGERGAEGPQGPPGEGIDYQGLIDATTAPEPVDPNNGDFYLNVGTGACSWTGVSNVTDGDRLVWNEGANQWDQFGAPDMGYLQEGDNISLLTNDANYITAADIPPSASTLQEVLDNGNTSTTDLWIGDGGETVKLLNNGVVDASNGLKAPAVEATTRLASPLTVSDDYQGGQITLTGGATFAFGTDTAQLGNVMPRDDWSSIPARA